VEQDKGSYNKTITIREDLKRLFSERTILAAAGVYFLVLFLIFIMDFIFLSALGEKYTDTDAFVQFKFNFYFWYSVVVVLNLGFLSEKFTRKIGVVQSLYFVPLFFMLAFPSLMVLKQKYGPVFLQSAFVFIIIFQFIRYFVFESIFSPNYQVIFSAFSKRFRGRAKLLMEGAVKPVAFIAAGLAAMFITQASILFLAASALCIVCLILMIRLKTTYRKNILEEITGEEFRRNLLQEISGKDSENILFLGKKCLQSGDLDLKKFAIEALNIYSSLKAFLIVRDQYRKDVEVIRECVARSLWNYRDIQALEFVRSLLKEPNANIRLNALISISNNPYFDRRNFKLGPLLDDPSEKVFLEALRIEWEHLDEDERMKRLSRIETMLNSQEIENRVMAMDFVGEHRLHRFLPVLQQEYNSNDKRLVVTTIRNISKLETRVGLNFLLSTLGSCTRFQERYIIRYLGRVSSNMFELIQEYFINQTNKRAVFSIIRIFEEAENRSLEKEESKISLKKEVERKTFNFAWRELEEIYREILNYYCLRRDYPWLPSLNLLKIGLREKRQHFAQMVLTILAVLDKSHTLVKLRGEIFNHLDQYEKANFIELVEAFGQHDLSEYLIPILEERPENELLRKGKLKWRYRGGTSSNSLDYFLASENLWIRTLADYVKQQIGSGDFAYKRV
jgi:hypothetical protein